MPYNSNEEIPKGVKGLPEGQQTKWRKVFNAAYEGTCKDSGDGRDECASRVAWSQISDKYKGKSTPLTSFSMRLKSVTHYKEEDQLRWKMVASDTDEDYYKDNMSMELFNDFTNRIEIKELVPEEFRSDFWSGGMPYISVSHYTDLDGSAVPGEVENVYIDGDQLHARGQFYKNKLGHACYHSCIKDLYSDPKPENPIRVSIAFLDYGHTHKSNNFEFTRKNIDDLCPECIMEQIRGEFSGKIFKKGQLVHLALTRVPANDRTSMEVEKSMTTRKEDAASIIGEELADELDEKAKLVNKSQALIIKAESEESDDKEYECPDDMSEEDCKKKMEEKSVAETVEVEKYMDEPVPVVVVDEYVPYKPYGGATSMKGAKDYNDAQKEQWRIADLWWAFQSIMDNIQNDETLEDKASAISNAAQELKDMIGDKSMQMYAILTQKSEVVAEVKPSHELDPVFESFKNDYDQIKGLGIPAEEKLRMLQDSSNRIGEEIRSHIITREPEAQQNVEVSNDLVQQLSLAMSNAMQPIASKLDLLLTQQSDNMVKSPSAIPVRRSIAPTLSMQDDIKPRKQVSTKQSTTPKLRALLERSLDVASGKPQ